MSKKEMKMHLMDYEKDGWLASNYIMNLHHGYDEEENSLVDKYDVIGDKKKVLDFVESKLSNKKGNVLIGLLKEPYSRNEKIDGLTRECLEILHKHHLGLSLITKSELILRDILALKKIQYQSPVAIHFTIATTDVNISLSIESRISDINKRLMAMEELSNHGLMVGVIMSPILPGVNDNEQAICDIVKAVYDSGGRWIVTYYDLAVNLKRKKKDYFYMQYGRAFFWLKHEYEKRYKKDWQLLMSEELWEVFVRECDKYAILYNYDEIVEYINENYRVEQKGTFC